MSSYVTFLGRNVLVYFRLLPCPTPRLPTPDRSQQLAPGNPSQNLESSVGHQALF